MGGGEKKMTNLLCVGVDVDDEFAIYDGITKRVARVGMVWKIEASELSVGIVAVNLRTVTGGGCVKLGDGRVRTYAQGRAFGRR